MLIWLYGSLVCATGSHTKVEDNPWMPSAALCAVSLESEKDEDAVLGDVVPSLSFAADSEFSGDPGRTLKANSKIDCVRAFAMARADTLVRSTGEPAARLVGESVFRGAGDTAAEGRGGEAIDGVEYKELVSITFGTSAGYPVTSPTAAAGKIVG